MTNRYTKKITVLIVFTLAGLVLKKLMVPGASIVIVLSLFSLSILFFIRALQSFSFDKEENQFRVSFMLNFGFSISSIGFLFRIQYWNGAMILLSIVLITLGGSILMVAYYLAVLRISGEMKKNIFRESVLPFIFFIPIISFSFFSNERQFHSFFKGSTYESYIRQTHSSDEAQRILEVNQCLDPACAVEAETYYREGLKEDSLKRYDEAFECFNKAINLNIHFAEAYLQRAENRMLHAAVDTEIMVNAIRDCSIAIALKPGYTQAYMRRGFTYMLKRNPGAACNDFKKAKELDGKLNIDRWIKSTCTDSTQSHS